MRNILFLIEPEGGVFLTDGVDVAGIDGTHDDESHENGDTTTTFTIGTRIVLCTRNQT